MSAVMICGDATNIGMRRRASMAEIAAADEREPDEQRDADERYADALGKLRLRVKGLRDECGVVGVCRGGGAEGGTCQAAAFLPQPMPAKPSAADHAARIIAMRSLVRHRAGDDHGGRSDAKRSMIAARATTLSFMTFIEPRSW